MLVVSDSVVFNADYKFDRSKIQYSTFNAYEAKEWPKSAS